MTGNCEYCGKWAELDRHHLIGGTGNKQLSERYNLTMCLCRECHRKAHEDPAMYKRLHQIGERIWISKYGTIEDFIKVFGKNYL